MNIALLGTGKTGSKVHEVVSDNDSITDFNHSHMPTVDELASHDVVISFLPGDAFLDHYPLLMEAKVPVVTGSTGFTWPENASEEIKQTNTAWITASNFSLGMQLVHDAIVAIGSGIDLLPDAHTSIHEIHHIHKKDSPSGTALKWQEWFGKDVTITSEKIGETVGDHQLTIETPTETIRLQHQAKDRKNFAYGAVWAAQHISALEPGLHNFEDVVAKHKGEES